MVREFAHVRELLKKRALKSVCALAAASIIGLSAAASAGPTYDITSLSLGGTTVIDGQATGSGGKDRFRIKVWRYEATLQQDVVDYDNQIDASSEGTLSEGTAIANGSIVIHTANK